MKKLALVFIGLCLVSVSCKKTAKDEASVEADANLTVFASLNSLSSGNIRVSSIDSSGTLTELTSSTITSGTATLVFKPGTGPWEISLTDAIYTNPITANIEAMSGGATLRVRLIELPTSGGVVISALTEIAVQSGIGGTGSISDNITKANNDVALVSGLIELTKADANPTGTPSSPSSQGAKYGLLLSGLFHYANSLSVNFPALITAFAADFKDGSFNGMSNGSTITLGAGNLSATGWSTGLGNSINSYAGNNTQGFDNSSRTTRHASPAAATASCSNGWVGGSHPTTCEPWTTCAAGTYVTAAGTATSDRSCSACGAGTFTSTTNQLGCTTHANCGGLSQNTLTPGTSTSNAVCTLDCVYTDWSAYSACSINCDGGEQYRTRQISQNARSGGVACNSGALAQTQSCNSGVACVCSSFTTSVSCVTATGCSWNAGVCSDYVPETPCDQLLTENDCTQNVNCEWIAEVSSCQPVGSSGSIFKAPVFVAMLNSAPGRGACKFNF